MKNQDLFSSRDKSKELKCRLLQFSFGPLWVNRTGIIYKKGQKQQQLQPQSMEEHDRGTVELQWLEHL